MRQLLHLLPQIRDALNVAMFVTVVPFLAHAAGISEPGTDEVTYVHDVIDRGPLSIHVVKVARASKQLELHSTQGKGLLLGVGSLSDQVKTLPADLGEPIAAINGDYAKAGLQYAAHPLGLQIMRGELVTAPGANVCFWVGADGSPHGGEVQAKFSLTWPDGRVTPAGLNDTRSASSAMIYSSAFGRSAGTSKGREIILERDGPTRWLPLPPGETIQARVREVREEGNTALSPETLVISLDPRLLKSVPAVEKGALIKISTACSPSLQGVKTALAGGPLLIQSGKVLSFKNGQESYLERHPRTAIGWNDQTIFMVVVDGRQKKLSIGMTLPELAAYLIKLGCREAVNLDGGGSSTFWYRGKVVSSPCEGRERPMVNSLVLVRKPDGAIKTAVGHAPAPGSSSGANNISQ